MKTFFSIVFILLSSYMQINAQGNINPKNKPYLEANASIAGKSGGTITKEEILNTKTLVLNSTDSSIYHIISFKMTIICKGQDLKEFEIQKNGELNSAMIEEIKKTTPGCKLYFEYIKAVDSTNLIDSIRSVRPLEFIVLI